MTLRKPSDCKNYMHRIHILKSCVSSFVILAQLTGMMFLLLTINKMYLVPATVCETPWLVQGKQSSALMGLYFVLLKFCFISLLGYL